MPAKNKSIVQPAKKTAFDAQRGSYFIFEPHDVIIMGIDTPHLPGQHALVDRYSNANPVDEAMVVNIIANGVIQAIEVRKEPGFDKPVVVNGRTRVRAARVANERLLAKDLPPVLIKCILLDKKYSTEDLIAVIISSNEHRREVKPMERAEKFGQYMKYGYSEEMVAAKLGFSVQYVKQTLKLRELEPEVKTAVASGAISQTAAVQLHGLTPEKQTEELNHAVTSGETTAKAVATRVKAVKRGTRDSETKYRPMTRAEMRDLVKANAEGRAPNLLPEFINAFRLSLGEIGPNSVQGAEEGFAAIGKEV